MGEPEVKVNGSKLKEALSLIGSQLKPGRETTKGDNSGTLRKKKKSAAKIVRDKTRLEQHLRSEPLGRSTQVCFGDLPNDLQIDASTQVDSSDLGSDIQFDDIEECEKMEEEVNLTRCLRLVIRHLHSEGYRVLFPVPEAVDRLLIRVAGLPDDPKYLWKLIKETYRRRGVAIVLENVFEDCVKANGIIAFNPTRMSINPYV